MNSRRNTSALKRAWLEDPSSLTKKLKQVTHDKIAFHVLKNNWGFADTSSCQTLALTDPKVWQREIEFRHQGVLWVAGTVLIPANTLQDSPTLQQNPPDHTPIGNVLFSNAREIKAAPFHFYAKEDADCRERIIHIDEQPILIQEVFYPAFFKWLRYNLKT